jgi:DNA replication protein DnaC
MIPQTLENLKALRLSVMEREYRRQQELPATASLPFDERFALLVDAEYRGRQNKKLERLLKMADLRDRTASLEELDYGPARHLDKAQVARLADCRWIHEGKNMLICGPCGTGKTFLASAFGNAACRRFLSVKSCRVSRLLVDLQVGRGDGSWSKLLRELKKPDLLILDDFGLANLETLHCRDLLEVIDDRHGLASTLVVSQLPVSSWHGLFADATIADAVLDRLLSGAHRFELTGPSLRRDRPAQEDAASLP